MFVNCPRKSVESKHETKRTLWIVCLYISENPIPFCSKCWCCLNWHSDFLCRIHYAGFALFDRSGLFQRRQNIVRSGQFSWMYLRKILRHVANFTQIVKWTLLVSIDHFVKSMAIQNLLTLCCGSRLLVSWQNIQCRSALKTSFNNYFYEFFCCRFSIWCMSERYLKPLYLRGMF